MPVGVCRCCALGVCAGCRCGCLCACGCLRLSVCAVPVVRPAALCVPMGGVRCCAVCGVLSIKSRVYSVF